MSPSEYQHLITFLAKKFDGIDARFDGIDERLDGVDKRFDGVDERFDGVDARFAGIDGRLGRLEISHEQLRDDVKANAEGILMNGERLDRVVARLDGMDDTLRGLARRATRDG